MSMLYRPLVRRPASGGRPEPPATPLREAPAHARDARLLVVDCDRARAAQRHRPLLPPCQRYPGDSCWPCQRLKHLRPTRRSSSQSGVQKPVGNEWRRWVKLENSRVCRRRRARRRSSSTLVAAGPSPSRRSPAAATRSPASRSISSSTVRRPIH